MEPHLEVLRAFEIRWSSRSTDKKNRRYLGKIKIKKGDYLLTKIQTFFKEIGYTSDK